MRGWDLGRTVTADNRRTWEAVCISYVVYIRAGDGASMLCDMLLRVTWLHMVCGASGRWLCSGGIVPSLYTVSRRVRSVVQGMPGSQ